LRFTGLLGVIFCRRRTTTVGSSTAAAAGAGAGAAGGGGVLGCGVLEGAEVVEVFVGC
jgi:hypothetical protein